MKIWNYRKYHFNIAVMAAIIFICIACEGDEIRKFNDGMKSISRAAHKMDTITQNISKGATKLSRKVENYVDTTVYKKDSTGMWIKKEKD